MTCVCVSVKWNLLGVSDEMGKMVIFNTDKSLSDKQAVVQGECFLCIISGNVTFYI